MEQSLRELEQEIGNLEVHAATLMSSIPKRLIEMCEVIGKEVPSGPINDSFSLALEAARGSKIDVEKIMQLEKAINDLCFDLLCILDANANQRREHLLGESAKWSLLTTRGLHDARNDKSAESIKFVTSSAYKSIGLYIRACDDFGQLSQSTRQIEDYVAAVKAQRVGENQIEERVSETVITTLDSQIQELEEKVKMNSNKATTVAKSLGLATTNSITNVSTDESLDSQKLLGSIEIDAEQFRGKVGRLRITKDLFQDSSKTTDFADDVVSKINKDSEKSSAETSTNGTFEKETNVTSGFGLTQTLMSRSPTIVFFAVSFAAMFCTFLGNNGLMFALGSISGVVTYVIGCFLYRLIRIRRRSNFWTNSTYSDVSYSPMLREQRANVG